MSVRINTEKRIINNNVKVLLKICCLFLCSFLLLTSLPTISLAYDAVCQLYLDISFKENMLFDKYDVTILVDDNEVDTIKYAEPFSHLIDLGKGEHTVTFCKKDNDTKMYQKNHGI